MLRTYRYTCFLVSARVGYTYLMYNVQATFTVIFNNDFIIYRYIMTSICNGDLKEVATYAAPHALMLPPIHLNY